VVADLLCTPEHYFPIYDMVSEMYGEVPRWASDETGARMPDAHEQDYVDFCQALVNAGTDELRTAAVAAVQDALGEVPDAERAYELTGDYSARREQIRSHGAASVRPVYPGYRKAFEAMDALTARQIENVLANPQVFGVVALTAEAAAEFYMVVGSPWNVTNQALVELQRPDPSGA
jgi:hypothetical protein